jgi:hypothetical protein
LAITAWYVEEALVDEIRVGVEDEASEICSVEAPSTEIARQAEEDVVTVPPDILAELPLRTSIPVLVEVKEPPVILNVDPLWMLAAL